jgi:hypothetical protein
VAQEFVGAAGGSREVAEAVENGNGCGVDFAAGIGGELGLNDGEGFLVQSQVQKGKSFVKFGSRIAQDHFWKMPVGDGENGASHGAVLTKQFPCRGCVGGIP